MNTPSAPRASFLDVLKQRNFALLWCGQIISSVGDRFYLFALLSVVLGIKEGLETGKDTARLTFCAMIPGLLLAPLYGWIVDHCDRRWVMIWADLLRVGFTLSLLYIWFMAQSLWGVYAIVFCMGAMNGLFIPARQAALPQIVQADQLVTANALISLIGVVANLGGTLFASLLVSIFGAWSSFVLNAFGFVISAGCIFFMTAAMAPVGSDSSHQSQGFWRESLGGWQVLREQPELKAIIWVASLFSFIGGVGLTTILQKIVVSMDLSYVRAIAETLTHFLTHFAPKPPVFEIRSLAFGLIFGCIGLGLGGGIGFCGWAQRGSRSKALPFFALSLLGIALIIFAELDNFVPALAGAVLLGFVSSLIVIPIEARLQNDVDDARRGRLFALKNLCTTVGFLLGLAVNIDGRLLIKVGPSFMISGFGIGALLIGLLLALWNLSSLKTFWTIRTPPQ